MFLFISARLGLKIVKFVIQKTQSVTQWTPFYLDDEDFNFSMKILAKINWFKEDVWILFGEFTKKHG